ncbi:MAG TPA: type II toxin-antitoxin system RelE/ParE family toxin [Desulfocapsa sulfexigens]|nr:type II toxin-antitoxin system RelE/ParE family toxin [Desulfocapsa sulfexigens]HIQ36585.1 type II toxin-antitoxin system RelE/ParE family toxin [Desulfocapsa sulfexigens]
MQVVFRPEAEQEIFEAQDWYESCSLGLGYEFARAVEVAVELAIRMPLAHPQIEGEYRHVILRRFPYSIIFLPFVSEILIVSCFHHKRKPLTWLK